MSKGSKTCNKSLSDTSILISHNYYRIDDQLNSAIFSINHDEFDNLSMNFEGIDMLLD